MDKAASVALARSNAKIAFFQWGNALMQTAVLEDAIRAAEEHQRDATNLFNADRASRADVLSAAAVVAADQLALQQGLETLRDADEQLRTLTHPQDGEVVTLGEDLTTALPPRPIALALMKQEALARRPDLQSLLAGEGALIEAAKLTRAGYFPQIGASADLSTSNPDQRLIPLEAVFHTSWDVGLQATWALNDAFTARTQAEQADANVDKFVAQMALARDSVLLEVTQASNASQTADASVVAADIRLSSAEEAYRVRRSLFRVGRATSVELTDAESALFSARITALTTRINQRIAAVRLDHALGRDVTPASP